MALDFPTSPALNQVYTFGSYSWRWDGTSWVGAVPIVNATINNTTIGAVTPSTGAFTTLSATTPIASSSGGTGNGFAKFSGPASSEKTFTLPNANATLLYDGGALGTPASGTVTNLTGTASININGTVGATTANTGLFTTIGASGSVLQDYNGGGGNSFTARYNSSNPRGGVYVMGGAGKVFYGDNLVYSSSNTFFADKAGTAWALADAGGSNVGLFYASGLSAGGTAFDFSTTTGRIGFWNTNGYNGAIGATTASTGAFTNLSASGTITSTLGAGSVSFAMPSLGRFYLDGGLDTFIDESAANNIRFVAGGGSVANISSTGLAVTGALSSTTGATFATSSGNVGIGVTTPERKLHTYIEEAAYTPTLKLQNGNASVIGYGTGIEFQLSTDFADYKKAEIRAIAEAAYGNDIALTFWSGGSSAGDHAERMRIDSSGNLLVGTTTAKGVGITVQSSSNTIWTTSTTSDQSALVVQNTNTGSVNLVAFQTGSGTGSGVGTITYNGSITLYNTTSDYRLKDITGPLTDSGAFIDALKPKVGTWKSNGSKFVGFVAHEFAEVCPSAVTGEKDAVDSDGKPVYQAMQASSAEVIANLVAELQSLRQRVAALESN